MVDEEGMPLIGQRGLILVKAAMGTGKGYMLPQVLGEDECLMASPTRSLESQSASVIGGWTRNDIARGKHDDPDAPIPRPYHRAENHRWNQAICAKHPRVTTTLAGLLTGHLNMLEWSKYTIILDEYVLMLSQLTRGSIFERERLALYDGMLEIVRCAKRTLVLDAGLEPWMGEMLARHAGLPEFTYVENEYRPKRGVLHPHKTKESLQAAYEAHYRSRPGTVYLTTSIADAERHGQRVQERIDWLQRHCGLDLGLDEPLVVTSKTTNPKGVDLAVYGPVKAFLGHPGATLRTNILGSPSMCVGVSLDADETGHARWTPFVCGQLQHPFRGMKQNEMGVGVDEIVQFAGRVRGNDVEGHIFVSTPNFEVPSPEEIREQFIARAGAAEESVFSRTDSGERLVNPDYEPLLELATSVTHRHLRRLANAREEAFAQLEAQGFEIGDELDLVDADERRAMRQEAREEQYAAQRAKAHRIAYAPRPDPAHPFDTTPEMLARLEIIELFGMHPECTLDPALALEHVRRERAGGLKAWVETIKGRAGDAYHALRVDAQRQGMCIRQGEDGEMIALPLPAERKWDIHGTLRIGPVDPYAPQDQLAEERKRELRLAVLSAAGIDPARMIHDAVRYINGLSVRPEQLKAAHRRMLELKGALETYGVVRKVAEEGDTRRVVSNMRSILSWWGLELHAGEDTGKRAAEAFWIRFPFHLQQALSRSPWKPPEPLSPEPPRLERDVTMLVAAWPTEEGKYQPLSADGAVDLVERLELMAIRALLSGDLAKSMGRLLSSWVRIGAPGGVAFSKAKGRIATYYPSN